jgi:hypothetical protein
VSLLGRLIRKIDRRWCAPKFANRLGPRLLRDYGASKFYTPGQIRTACAKCGLPRRQLALGYAAFLRKAEFETTTEAALHADYRTLRSLFFRFTGRGEDFSVAPAPMNAYVEQALYGSSGKGGDHTGSASPD